MTPHMHSRAKKRGLLPVLHQALADLEKVKTFISRMPEPPYCPEVAHFSCCGLGSAVQPYWSCHAVTRAAARYAGLELPWQVCDGYFYDKQMHTWLIYPQKQTGHLLLLDVYPVAVYSPPILLELEGGAPWHHIYIEKPERYVHETAGFDMEAFIAGESLLQTEAA